MNYKIIRFRVNEVEDRAFRVAAEHACRRPEDHARWLLRQALGISDGMPTRKGDQPEVLSREIHNRADEVLADSGAVVA